MLPRLSRVVQRVRTDLSRWRLAPGRMHIVHAQIEGFELLVRADEDVGRAIHFAHAFEEYETAYLRGVIARDAVCVDVGANIGYFSLLMASIARDGIVHAFEPLPLNAALLAASAALNRFENIHINRSAVGDTVGEIEFTEAEDSAYSSLRDTGRKTVGRRIAVPMTTLDVYLEGGRVDVLKVDVEGAEGLVLAGAAATIGDPTRRPTVIMIELFQSNLDIFGARVDDIVAGLTDRGYRAFGIDTDGKLIDHRTTPTPQYNLVFTAPRG